MCVKLELISIEQGCQDSMRQIPLSFGIIELVPSTIQYVIFNTRDALGSSIIGPIVTPQFRVPLIQGKGFYDCTGKR